MNTLRGTEQAEANTAATARGQRGGSEQAASGPPLTIELVTRTSAKPPSAPRQSPKTKPP